MSSDIPRFGQPKIQAAPRDQARNRLLEAKRGQGQYHWVSQGSDPFSAPSASRPNAPDISAIHASQSRQSKGPLSGMSAAATLFGGIAGGDILGGWLAEAKISRWIEQVQNGLAQLWTRLQTWLQQLPKPMANTTPSRQSLSTDTTFAISPSIAEQPNERALQPKDDSREQAKLRLKNAILSASLINPPTGSIRFGQASALSKSPFHQANLQFSGQPKFLTAGHEVVKHLPIHNLSQPVAAIDIGSTSARLVLLKDQHSPPIEERYPLQLGEQLGQTGRLDETAVQQLDEILHRFKTQLTTHQVAPEHIRAVATAGLRDLMDNRGQDLSQRLSDTLGSSIEIISPLEEATLVYRSVLRGLQRMSPHQKNLVIEIGGGSTEFAFGKGQRKVEAEPTEEAYLPMGSAKLLLENAFSPVDVALAREKVQTMLSEHIAPESVEAAQGRTAYLSYGDSDTLLSELERSLPAELAEQRDLPPQLLWSDGLPMPLIKWYLSPEGLSYLQSRAQDDTFKEAAQTETQAFHRLVGKLVILAESGTRLNLTQFTYGHGGGLKSGLLDQLLRQQIKTQAIQTAKDLHARYTREYPIALDRLKQIFPEFSDQIHGRSKDPASIADKLFRKAVRTEGFYSHLQMPNQNPLHLIGDGHGLSLILNDPSRDTMAQIRNRLIQGIRRGDVQLLEINNLRGPGSDALPYLTQDDVERLRMAVSTKRWALPPEQRGPQLNVLDGPNATKSSGYTTTQLNMQLRNPETGEFDLPQLELQIRGEQVHAFYAIEHLVYDIRQGKNIYKNHEVQSYLEKDMQPLLEAIETMSQEQFKTFSEYLSQYYLYCRRQESGYVVPEPKLPDGLPEVCEVAQLKPLSEKRRALIREFPHAFDEH